MPGHAQALILGFRVDREYGLGISAVCFDEVRANRFLLLHKLNRECGCRGLSTEYVARDYQDFRCINAACRTVGVQLAGALNQCGRAAHFANAGHAVGDQQRPVGRLLVDGNHGMRVHVQEPRHEVFARSIDELRRAAGADKRFCNFLDFSTIDDDIPDGLRSVTSVYHRHAL